MFNTLVIVFYRESTGELGWAGALNNGLEGDLKDVGVSLSLDKFESRSVQVRGICAVPGTYIVGSAFSVTTIGDNKDLDVTNVSNNTSLLVVEQVG